MGSGLERKGALSEGHMCICAVYLPQSSRFKGHVLGHGNDILMTFTKYLYFLYTATGSPRMSLLVLL